MAEWREHREDIEAGRVAAAAEVARLTTNIEEMQRDGAAVDAQTALVTMLDGLRAVASRYDADTPEHDLVASLRMAMSETIEAIEITPNAVPIEEIRHSPDPDVEARTVYLVREAVTIGVVVRRTDAQDVLGPDGASYEAELPAFDRASLSSSKNLSLTCATHLRDCR